MAENRPILAWLRRDLRLGDHPMLAEAARSGRPVIPVFILDEVVSGEGAAPRWRLERSVAQMAARLGEIGSRLVLRRGRAADVLAALVEETGAGDIWWTHAYDRPARQRDEAVQALPVSTRDFGGHLLFEPWSVETQTGGPYKVYTPFWRAVHARPVASPLPEVTTLRPPEGWPASDDLAAWGMGADMNRGAEVVAQHARIGEVTAHDRLAAFVEGGMAGYADGRNELGRDGTSGLSEHLACGEISPHTCWHTGRRAEEEGVQGASTWLRELVWREFAYHVLWHAPNLMTDNWRPEWDAFPWRGDNPDAVAWCRGLTGVPLVDAGLREMYVTGRMHNRARMVVASYLTKHLLTHWRVGHDWFAECLTDWDPANNALGWQWSAGSGPDAAPYFRVFNPLTQAKKFDPDGTYLRRWIAEGQKRPPQTALSFFEAIPRSWDMSPGDLYPEPVIPVDEGRKRALAAYEGRGF